jgi:hypothetical protein
LDAGRAHVYLIAGYDDFARWKHYENAFWISFVSACLGLALLTIGIRELTPEAKRSRIPASARLLALPEI